MSINTCWSFVCTCNILTLQVKAREQRKRVNCLLMCTVCLSLVVIISQLFITHAQNQATTPTPIVETGLVVKKSERSVGRRCFKE